MTVDVAPEVAMARIMAERRSEPKVSKNLFQFDPQALIQDWEFATTAEKLLMETGLNSTADYVLGPNGLFDTMRDTFNVPKRTDLMAVKATKPVMEEVVGRALYHWQREEGKGKLVGWGELAAAIKMADNLGLAVLWKKEGHKLVIFNEDELGYSHTYAGQEIATEKRVELKGGFLVVAKSQAKKEGYERLTIASGGKEPIEQALTAAMGDPCPSELAESQPAVDPLELAHNWEGQHPKESIVVSPDITEPKIQSQYLSGYRKAGVMLASYLDRAATIPAIKNRQLGLCAALTAAANETILYRRVKFGHNSVYKGMLQALNDMATGCGLVARELNLRENLIKLSLSVNGESGPPSQRNYTMDSLMVIVPAQGVGSSWDWVKPLNDRDSHTDVISLANLIPGFQLELPASPQQTDLK
jgi:hypothetical protein